MAVCAGTKRVVPVAASIPHRLPSMEMRMRRSSKRGGNSFSVNGFQSYCATADRRWQHERLCEGQLEPKMPTGGRHKLEMKVETPVKGMTQGRNGRTTEGMRNDGFFMKTELNTALELLRT